MKIYNYSDLTDSQIICRHKPFLLYVLILVTFFFTLVFLLSLGAYVNATNNFEEGKLLAFDKRHIVAPTDGYIENQVSVLTNSVIEGELLATIDDGGKKTHVMASGSGAFTLKSNSINGSYVAKGTPIGELKKYEDMYIASLFSNANKELIAVGDVIHIQVPELGKEFEGEIYHIGPTTLDGQDYNVIINLDNKLKGTMNEGMTVILTMDKKKETLQHE